MHMVCCIIYVQLSICQSQLNGRGLCSNPNMVLEGFKELVWYLLSLTLKCQLYQLQITSTESFFIIFGHGSPPNCSGATLTEHAF